MSHQGHVHWTMPLDFTNIQLSVWIALLPATIFVYMNFGILKMENVEEYMWFKRENGLTKLRNMAFASWFCFGVYMTIVALNIQTFLKANKKSIAWQNFEGMIIYSLMVCQCTSLWEYAKSKYKNLKEAMQESRGFNRKKDE